MKTIREYIDLIESAQNPVAEDQTTRTCPTCDGSGEDALDPTKSCRRCGGKGYIPFPKEQGVAEGTDDDVEHLANTFADLYWSGKIGMTSATEKVKMAHKIIQAVEDGRLSVEELKQDISDLDNKGVAEGTNGWVVYNIRGRIIKNFADEAEARQYAKQYGFYVKPQGVAEAISKNDLLNRLQKDLPRVDDPKNKDAEPVNWTGPKKGDYGYTGYQGHGMPTDRAERARIRADKKKQQDK